MRREASGAAASSASGLEPQRQQGEGKHVAEARRTLLEKTADTVEELYHLRDTFFPRDPTEKPAALRACADAALAVLDSLPAEQRKSPQQRAVYEFLMGKILDVFPDYHKEAEEHLSKAVKLNPSLIDAWLCLGNCIWKKGDLESAKNCFLSALSKGSDKRILCQLSMLERSMAQGKDAFYHIVSPELLVLGGFITDYATILIPLLNAKACIIFFFVYKDKNLWYYGLKQSVQPDISFALVFSKQVLLKIVSRPYTGDVLLEHYPINNHFQALQILKRLKRLEPESNTSNCLFSPSYTLLSA